MCLAAFAFGASGDYPLVFAANRDELHTRPTAAADWWADHPHILGGRDLMAGGTWLAVDQRGRLGAVTNGPSSRGRTYEKSRGHLVADYLAGDSSAREFISHLDTSPEDYGPYNLLLFDGADFHYSSNQATTRQLVPGTYALSNAPLGTRWPKVHFAESMLASTLTDEEPASRLFAMLENRHRQREGPGGDSGNGRQARVFIEDETFGTRSSTVVLVTDGGEVHFLERRHNRDGTLAGESAHRFKLTP